MEWATGAGGGIEVGGGIGDRGGSGNDVNRYGDADGARTITRVEANEPTQDKNGDESGDEMGRERERERRWRLVDEHKMGKGTRTGSGRAEERRRSAKNRTKVIDVMWETGETCVERGKNGGNKGFRT